MGRLILTRRGERVKSAAIGIAGGLGFAGLILFAGWLEALPL